MYLFYNLCTTLHVSKDHFVHHQEFIIYRICISGQNMLTCLTARSYGWNLLRCPRISFSVEPVRHSLLCWAGKAELIVLGPSSRANNVGSLDGSYCVKPVIQPTALGPLHRVYCVWHVRQEPAMLETVDATYRVSPLHSLLRGVP